MPLSRRVGSYPVRLRKVVDLSGSAPALLVFGVALSAVLLMASADGSQSGNAGFSYYALIAAGLVCVAGLGVLTKIAFDTRTGGDKRGETRVDRGFLGEINRAADQAVNPVKTLSGPDQALLSRRQQTIDALTKQAYWEQDAYGTYQAILLSPRNEQHALLTLQGSRRGGIAGDWFEPESSRDLPAKIARLQPFHDIVWYRTLPSGEILRVRESGMPRFDQTGGFIGYQGSIEEITAGAAETRPMRLALNALEATPLPCAIVHSLTGNGTMARQWSLMWANPALIAQTDFQLNNLQQIPLAQWFGFNDEDDTGDSDKAPFTNPEHRLNAESSYRADGVLMNRYGDPKAVNITFDVIDQAQPGTSTLVIFDPISPDINRLERESHELEVLRRTEVRRTVELEATARELESFSHTVSHDLRAPIRHVAGFAELLAEKYSGVLDSVGMDSIARIVAASQRMDSMLDALIELHRVSSTPVVTDPLDLSTIAQSIADEIQRETPNPNLTIQIQPGLRIRGDHMLMRMTMWNLISNAVKFSSRNPQPRVTVSLTQVDGINTYSVSDNGVGFNPASADGLFRPFTRLHPTADYPGTGIGLATVQRIVRRHGGHIWAESAPDQGARFYFTLWG